MSDTVYDKSFLFAIRIVNAYKWLVDNRAELVLSKQLLRCGTSIGANVSEAKGAFSKADFAFKMSTAYKECLETQYWLKLLKDTKYLDEKVVSSLFCDADEIGRILYAIVKTAKKKQ